MSGKEARDYLNTLRDEDLNKPFTYYNTEWACFSEINEIRTDDDQLAAI